MWVEGEVSNCHAAQSGHLYFTLKDPRAQIRCVCFRDQVRALKFRPEDGLHVTVRGAISVYDVRGEYQIYVTSIEPVGLGALQLAFEQLKKRLQAEGLFDAARKKPLPVLPLCIGVVTSPTGAAIRDILRVLKRRFPNAHVRIYPVKVQGDGAAKEIAAAVAYFNRGKFADVLIVARGGGSLEDLWAFNEEVVARAIAASEIPVITGIGHEVDFTIADFVADLRAPTPSAAAELVVKSRQEFERHIAEHQRQLVQQIRFWISQRRHRVRDLETHRGFRRLEVLVRRRRQQVDDLSQSLAIGLRLRLGVTRQRLTKASARIGSFDLRGRALVIRRRIEQHRLAVKSALDRIVARKRQRSQLRTSAFCDARSASPSGAMATRCRATLCCSRLANSPHACNEAPAVRSCETAARRAQPVSHPRARLRNRLRWFGESVAHNGPGRARGRYLCAPGSRRAWRDSQAQEALTVLALTLATRLVGLFFPDNTEFLKITVHPLLLVEHT